MTADEDRQDLSKEELQRQLDEVHIFIHPPFVSVSLAHDLLASFVLVLMTVVTAAVGARALHRLVVTARALLVTIIGAIARQSHLTDTMVAMGALVAARGRLVATRASTASAARVRVHVPVREVRQAPLCMPFTKV